MPLVYSIGTGVPGTAGVADLTLDAVQQLGYEQVPVWDGPTYLYTIHRLHIRGTYNPANGFAWSLGNQVIEGANPGGYSGKFPILVPGMLAPATNISIRHFLMQPRGTITYNIGGVVQPIPGAGAGAGASTVVITGGIEDLHCPTNLQGADENDAPKSYQTDCKNGPIPLHCNVVEIKGNKTYLVDWAFECYVNEAFIFRKSTTLSALLSQRWRVEEDLDQDFFATRTIVGHAIFRADRLQVLNAVADDFRGWLMHPLQNGFRRAIQEIVISEDGTRLDYVLVDREVPFSLTPTVVGRGVTRIEAYYTQGYLKSKNAEEALYSLGEAALGGILYKYFAGAKYASKAAAAAAAKTNAAKMNNALDLLGAGASGFIDAIPRYQQHMVCRVWGNNKSKRADLYQTALEVLAAKIPDQNIRVGSGSIMVSEDLMGKFIELDCTTTFGPTKSIYQAGFSYLAFPIVEPSDLINGVTQSQAYQQPLPPLDHGTRSNLYAAVTQVLTGADDIPPRTNNDRFFESLDPQGFDY